MTALLSVEGPVYRVLSGWWWLIRIGLIWFLGCLPVVTVPLSTIWLLDTVQRQLSGRPPADGREILALLKALSWPALRLAGLHVLALAVLLGAALGPSPGGLFTLVLPAVVVCVGATWLLLAPWSFAALLRHRLGATAAISRAYLTSIRFPLLAMACVGGLAACGAIVFLTPAGLGLLVLPALPGLAGCLLMHTYDRADLRHRRPRGEPSPLNDR